jgi:hypothetical protein
MTTTRGFRVLITGSRTWTDPDPITRVLNQLHSWQTDRLVIVHGACRNGVDAIADAWCRHNSVSAERHPADWQRHGKAAGPRRNAVMVATKPALCLAFIRDNSPGATGCANTAEKAGIPTVRYRHDQTDRCHLPYEVFLHGRWYAQPNDLIGGWSVMPVDQPPSAARLPDLASFASEHIARHIATLHNQQLEDRGGER